jgi:type IV pilus secretin PilQ/predicted competence protein
MKKTTNLLLLVILIISAGLISSPLPKTPLINISKISVQPGPLNTRVILQTDSPLTVLSSGYAGQDSRIVVLNLDRIGTMPDPPAAADPKALEKIEAVKGAENQMRLMLHLKERLPYRIYSQSGETVVELNKIQNGNAPYVIDPDLKKALDEKTFPNLTLGNIEISEMPDRVTIDTPLGGQALSQVFVLNHPLRLVVDLFGTVYTGTSSAYPVEKMGLEKVRVAQFQTSGPSPITRMVFDLAGPGQYAISNTPRGMAVSFFNENALSLSEPAATEIAKPAAAEVQPSPEPVHPKPAVAEKKQDTPPPPITEAAKAEKKAESPAAQAQNNTTEATKPQQESQSPDQKFKPKIIQQTEQKYSGDLITLRFKDADLRDLILYIGQEAGLNVIFDPEVRGVITCNMESVPWDQALDILLKNNKLGRVIEGNILRVAPMATLTAEDAEQLKLQESKELAGPLQTRTITLSYSKASDIQALLNSKKSTRGIIDVDARTNTLIISEVKEKLDLLERLISVLDTPTPQVSIEARIVEATSTFVRNLGINWGWRGIADPFYGNQTSIQFPNKVLIDGGMIPQGEVTKGLIGPVGGYAVNLPAPAFTTAAGFSLANVLDTFRIDLALTALETSGDGKVISQPKITTQNNMQAEIIQGRQIPVQTVANFTVTTRYVNAALELRATPQITAEGTIIMTIDIKNDAADFSNLVNGIPPITTQSARTTVMVPDGGTTVIGGIYRTEDSVTRERVPFLHQIPILGKLFRSFARTKQNRELLIFITPRIIK